MATCHGENEDNRLRNRKAVVSYVRARSTDYCHWGGRTRTANFLINRVFADLRLGGSHRVSSWGRAVSPSSRRQKVADGRGSCYPAPVPHTPSILGREYHNVIFVCPGGGDPTSQVPRNSIPYSQGL